MRTGILISAVSHAAVVALALLGTPKLFESTHLEAIEVDLVRAQEPEPPPKEPQKKPDKPAEWNPLPPASASPPAPPVQETAAPSAKTKPAQPTQQQASAAQPPAAEPPAPTPTPTPTPQQPWIFDPTNIPALMNLPNAPQAGFDAEATTAANLSSDERSAFKSHLKKCWKLPDGMSPAQSTRVTLRIYLKRDGGLAAEPTLIEASASRDGPRLLQAAIRSVKDCQPFAFLPPDRYREWKALDVSFSPKEMAGG